MWTRSEQWIVQFSRKLFLVDYRAFFSFQVADVICLMLFVTFSFIIAFSFNQTSQIFDCGEWSLPQCMHLVGFLLV